MVRDAVEAGADIIMLDNMDNDRMQQAIEIIGGRAEVEISGNITAQRVSQIKDLKADYISSGALTHSAPSIKFFGKIIFHRYTYCSTKINILNSNFYNQLC